MRPSSSPIARTVLTALGASVIAALPLALGACDKTVESKKTTTTKTTQTPEGTRTTTETTKRTVETEPKQPPR